MSLLDSLRTILDIDTALRVVMIVNEHDAQKRYLESDKGKAARKKAQSTYYQTHGKIEKGDVSHVHAHVRKYLQPMIAATRGEMTWEELNNFKVYTATQDATGTELWKHYCLDETNPTMTRARYVSHIPGCTTTPTHRREGRIVRREAFVFELCQFIMPL